MILMSALQMFVALAPFVITLKEVTNVRVLMDIMGIHILLVVASTWTNVNREIQVFVVSEPVVGIYSGRLNVAVLRVSLGILVSLVKTFPSVIDLECAVQMLVVTTRRVVTFVVVSMDSKEMLTSIVKISMNACNLVFVEVTQLVETVQAVISAGVFLDMKEIHKLDALILTNAKPIRVESTAIVLIILATLHVPVGKATQEIRLVAV